MLENTIQNRHYGRVPIFLIFLFAIRYLKMGKNKQLHILLFLLSLFLNTIPTTFSLQFAVHAQLKYVFFYYPSKYNSANFLQIIHSKTVGFCQVTEAE